VRGQAGHTLIHVNPRTRRLVTSLVLVALVAIVVIAAFVR
jgi:hypothetical protein